MKAAARSPFRAAEDFLVNLLFAALVAVLAAEIVARVAFRSGVPSSPLIISHLVLSVGLVAGMITTREREHLSIALVQYLRRDRLKLAFSVAAHLISAFVATVCAWSAASFVKLGLSPWRLVGFVPDQIFALVLPLGYGTMAVRFAVHAPLRGRWRFLPFLSLAAATFCSFPVISKLLWGFDSPDWAFLLNERLASYSYAFRVPLSVALIAAALFGTPLFIVLGGLALVLIQASGGEMDVVANQAYTLLTGSSIAAIPLFTVVGFFLSESDAGGRLVRAFRGLFGWLPGGMIIATVVVCAFFTTFTGASGVTILALGGILFSVLTENEAYPRRFVVGLLTAVGSIGLLFPPSLPIILVGAATRTNILHLFVGGVVPGIALVLSMVAFGVVSSLRRGMAVEAFSPRRALSALRLSFWELLLPVLLIGGYFSGFLSIVEIGAAAVVYVFAAEVLLNRDIPLRSVPAVLAKAMPIIGGVLSILALSQALSYYIVDSRIPERLSEWVVAAVRSKYLFLLLLNLALVAVGCLMDIFSAILIVLPLIAPLGAAYGIDPVHLGIIFILNMELGFLTPPIGLNLFLASYRFKLPFVEVSRSVLPFLAVQAAVVLLVTYVPWFTSVLLPLFD